MTQDIPIGERILRHKRRIVTSELRDLAGRLGMITN
jgi:hypothetical protein